MSLTSSVRLGTAIPERCLNPVCGRPVEPIAEGTWRRTPKRFCSDRCKNETSVLRRAAKLLDGLSQGRVRQILKGLNPGRPGRLVARYAERFDALEKELRKHLKGRRSN